MTSTPLAAPPLAASPPRDATRCRHCGDTYRVARRGRGDDGFCCTGCAAAHDFLVAQGLERYYALRGPRGVAAGAAGAASDRAWLEPVTASLAARAGAGAARVDLDVQGLHCAACVWVVQELFRRRRNEDALGVLVDPAAGTIALTVGPAFELPRFVADVEALGYRLGPPAAQKRGDAPGVPRALVARVGVAVALALQAMVLAVAVYAGLDGGPTYVLFQRLALGLATVSVLVGAPVFARSSLAALRRGVLHLDLPIVLGMVLAWASSVVSYVRGGGAASYFDTLTVFVALMLVGRWLQERVLARNRAALLSSSGAQRLFVRRVGAGGALELVRVTRIEAGDRLELAPGDLVPVDADLPRGARLSLDWINGESAPRDLAPGAVAPAGAFSCEDAPLEVVARTAFEGSTLERLLRTPTPRVDEARTTPFWARLGRVYVAAVLGLAGLTLAGWLALGPSPSRALEVVAAVLIVSCPCAFGIAVPLAYDLAHGGLRREGLFVRSPSFLDRARAVRRVVFDKTGTLTLGVLTARADVDLDRLTPVDRAALTRLVEATAHPKARAVGRALAAAGRATAPPGDEPGVDAQEAGERSGDGRPHEFVGRGVELVREGVRYRLGAPAWACEGTRAWLAPRGADVLFTRDGTRLTAFETREELRDDAADEVGALRAAGFDVLVLSGDDQARVDAVADRVGLPPDRALGGRSPEDKAEVIAGLDAGDLLFVGDGLNDAPAAARATASGTTALDRPFMAARTDFYVSAAGLRPIRLALVVARRLHVVVQRNLVVAVAYNVVTVGLAVAGRMSPLLCAVLMPLASLSTVLATAAALSPRSATWRS